MRLKQQTVKSPVTAPRADVQAVFREFMRLERKRGKEGLSVAELQQWTGLKQALSQRLQPDLKNQHGARRESVRVPVRLDVSFASYGEIRESLMTNLSRGGLFVATESPLDIGTKIQLTIRLRALERPLEVMTEVVSQNLGHDLRREAAGMGLRFMDLSPAQQQLIDDLYEISAREAVKAIAEDSD